MGQLSNSSQKRFEGGQPFSRFVVQRLLTYVAFGKNDLILAATPPPPHSDIYWLAVHYFARGVAQARQGQVQQAKSELQRFRSQVKEFQREKQYPLLGLADFSFRHFGGDPKYGLFPIDQVLKVAEAELVAHIALASNAPSAAAKSWRSAAVAEQAFPLYEETPSWYLPVPQRLGAALLLAGQLDEAVDTYHDSLSSHPNDGWILFGLLQA